MAIPIVAPRPALPPVGRGVERAEDGRRDRRQGREARRARAGRPPRDGAEDPARPRPAAGRIDVLA